jgi:hypothetical protein
MANKETYARRGREMATSLALQMADVLGWRDVYWDRTYNSGGADEIVDADVADLDITAADITGLITFADALETFLVANDAYLSNMRQDM